MSDYISREAALESFGDAPMWTGYYEPYSFYYREAWYWWSCGCEDLLVEYSANETDQVDDDVEITHWMSLPELPKG